MVIDGLTPRMIYLDHSRMKIKREAGRLTKAEPGRLPCTGKGGGGERVTSLITKSWKRALSYEDPHKIFFFFFQLRVRVVSRIKPSNRHARRKVFVSDTFPKAPIATRNLSLHPSRLLFNILGTECFYLQRSVGYLTLRERSYPILAPKLSTKYTGVLSTVNTAH